MHGNASAPYVSLTLLTPTLPLGEGWVFPWERDGGILTGKGLERRLHSEYPVFSPFQQIVLL